MLWRMETHHPKATRVRISFSPAAHPPLTRDTFLALRLVAARRNGGYGSFKNERGVLAIHFWIVGNPSFID